MVPWPCVPVKGHPARVSAGRSRLRRPVTPSAHPAPQCPSHPTCGGAIFYSSLPPSRHGRRAAAQSLKLPPRPGIGYILHALAGLCTAAQAPPASLRQNGQSHHLTTLSVIFVARHLLSHFLFSAVTLSLSFLRKTRSCTTLSAAESSARRSPTRPLSMCARPHSPRRCAKPSQPSLAHACYPLVVSRALFARPAAPCRSPAKQV